MKKLFGMAIALGLAVTTIGVHALSIGQDNMFLKADTAKECQNIGGTYTKLKDTNYCTSNPSKVLTQSEQTKISDVAKRILTIIDADKPLYNKVMNILESYKVEFMGKKDTKRLAISMFIEQNIKNNYVTIPTTCGVWFDGCNTCQVLENGEMACTKMYCDKNEAPKCLENKAPENKVPKNCGVWFDGCNTCQVMENGEMACTLMYCEKNEAPKCLENKIPKTCSVRFDGCNTCQIMENGEMACTKMFCEKNETPKCLKHK